MNTSDNPLITNQLPISEYIPAQWEDFRNFIDLHLKRVSNAVNTKESSLYLLQETGSFKGIFTLNDPNKRRNGYRYVMDVVDEEDGNLTAGNTYSFPHGIDVIEDCLLVQGGATTSGGDFIPLPWVSATAIGEQIEIWADATYINVTLGASAPTLTQCYVVFEYTKN